jgi:hypothetical protein
MVSMDSNITKTQETGDYNSKNSNFDNPKIRKTEQSTVNTEQKAGNPVILLFFIQILYFE